jgi:hypothetical protein
MAPLVMPTKSLPRAEAGVGIHDLVGIAAGLDPFESEY